MASLFRTIITLGAFLLTIISAIVSQSNSGQVLSDKVIKEEKQYLENIVEANVVRVIDGDTIETETNKKEIVKVRLIGINTPEMNDKREKVKCLANQARDYLANKLLNKEIILKTDESQSKYDRYGRLLGYVYLENKMINLDLISQGYAYEYTYSNPYQYQVEFKQAQLDAQENLRGLWNEENCN